MAHAPELREKVRAAYVYQRLALEVAALQAGVSLRTAQAWRKKAEGTPEDWDKARAVVGMSTASLDEIGRELLDNFLISFKSTQEAVLNGDFDAQQKTEMLASLAYTFEGMMRTLKKLMPDVNRAVVAKEVVDMLADYIKREHPESLPAFVKILGGFAKELVAHTAKETKRK